MHPTDQDSVEPQTYISSVSDSLRVLQRSGGVFLSLCHRFRMGEDTRIKDPPGRVSSEDQNGFLENRKRGEHPGLSVNTSSDSVDDSSKIDMKITPMTPAELLKRAFSPESLKEAFSPALDAAKTVMPQVEPISFRNFAGLSIKVAFP